MRHSLLKVFDEYRTKEVEMEFSALKKSGLWEALSLVGKRCYLPPGIISWGAQGTT